MAEGGGTGITTMPVLQSLSQARDRWGDHAANAIWDASIAKIILGGTSSARDLQDLSALIGERDEHTDSISIGDHGSRSLQRSTRRVAVMPPEVIRTLPFGTGLVLLRSSPPLVTLLDPWTQRARARPDAPEDAILPTVVQELAALYLDGLDPATREALDTTCVLRRVTLSLLEAVVPGEPPQAALARLAALPFAELGREGLAIHDTVREAVAALLRATDPVRHRAYHAAAWRQIRRELTDAAARPAGRRWRTCSRWWRSRSSARPSSRRPSSTTRSSARAPATAPRSRRSPPATSRPSRSRCSARGGRRCRARSGSRATRAGAWWRSRSCASWARCRGACSTRTRCAPRGGGTCASTPCRPASRCCWRATRSRTAPARRPRRAWPRCCATWSARRWRPARRCGGSTPSRTGTRCSPRSPRSASRRCRAARTWRSAAWPTGRSRATSGPESVAGWVSKLAARDAAVEETRLDEGARELVLDGRRIALTRLECDVLRHLREREGRAVARETLLRDVWGYEWTGGSNVVEVAVSGLRRKLGARAGALETVRGVGYRLRRL